MRKLSGFSLMEMMVVLLITAIVAAASVPIVNKKLMVDQAKTGCPWIYTGLDGSIAYNIKNNDNQTAIIGATSTNGDNPSLYINGKKSQPALHIKAGKKDSTTVDHIKLTSSDNSNVLRLGFENESIYFTSNSINNNNKSVVLGYGAGALQSYSSLTDAGMVAIGHNANARIQSVAVGADSKGNELSTAIGFHAKTADSSIAIGRMAETKNYNWNWS